MKKVVVKWFDDLKGMGEGVDEKGHTVFLHYSAISSPERFATLTVGQIISCDLQQTPEGFKAKSIELTHTIDKLKGNSKDFKKPAKKAGLREISK